MRIYQEGRDYTEWVEDLEYYIMGLGLSEEENNSRCLGLFITNGGSKVKEVYNMNKGTVKAQYKDNNDAMDDVSEYRHARNIVDNRMKAGLNQALTTFNYRNLKQREGEAFNNFVHRCVVFSISILSFVLGFQ